MNKVFIIIQREILSRIRKPSFIAMCALGPLMIVLLWLLPFYLVNQSKGHKIIAVVDETGVFKYKLKNSDQLTFLFQNNIDVASDMLEQQSVTGIIFIEKDDNSIPSFCKFYYNENIPSILIQSYIQTEMQNALRKNILVHNYQLSNEDASIIENSFIDIRLQNITGGTPKYYNVRRAVGIICGLMIYFFIFMFASWVMRGVVEEKSNRILEVMVSSIRPIQLMTGKIIGIACVGLLQFLCWIIFSYAIITSVQHIFPETFTLTNSEKVFLGNQKIPTADQMILKTLETQKENSIIKGLFSINYGLIISMFIFYFLIGYLLYAAIFAAIGAITDNETETQQFVAPVTIPLLIGVFVAILITAGIIDPKGQLAYVLSIMPFTSPIVMMSIIPFGVSIWQLIISAILLILTFFLILFFSSKIYKVGILMYGKKITYKELWKWIKY